MELFDDLTLAQRSSKRRNRSREDAGKSPLSWKKHDLIKKAVSAQFHAFRVKHPQARCLFVDMNAGDGEGVEIAQKQLAFSFIEIPQSVTTAELAVRNADDLVDVVLCEKNKKKFEHLQARFGHVPGVTIIRDHADVLSLIAGYDYVIVLSDPCGPAGHGEETLAAISRSVPKADFIIALNVSAVKRINGTYQTEAEVGRAGKSNATSRKRHGWKNDPIAWRNRLGRREVAVSRGEPVRISRAFWLRVLVVTDYLVVKDTHFERVFS